MTDDARPSQVRLGWRDWLAPLDWYLVLWLAAALLVMRFPGSFLFLLVAPLIVILARGLRLRTGLHARSLWLMILVCLGAAALSVVVVHPALITSTSNTMVIMSAVALLTIATLYTGAPALAVRRLMQGLYCGLLGVFAISVGEIVTGIKLLPLLHPEANTAAAIRSHRFYAAATYPNYNDYSVAMAMLVAGLTAQLIFHPAARPPRTIARLGVALAATALVAHMGSRGALAGLLLMVGLVLVLGIRSRQPGWFGVRKLLLGGMLGAVAALGIVSSPYVQDNSTMVRGQIVTNTIAMMKEQPINALVGYGQYAQFGLLAEEAYPRTLMDPHNLGLELVSWYGIGGLVSFVIAWLIVVWQGFVKLHLALTWHTVMPLVIVVSLPLLGIVPSSTLRYHVVWLLLIGCYVPIAVWRRQVRGAAPVTDPLRERIAERTRSLDGLPELDALGRP